MRWAGHGNDNTYSILVMQSEGKEPLGMPRCTQEYNIKLHLQECSRSWSGHSNVADTNLLQRQYLLTLPETWMIFDDVCKLE
jgi:hypothetical protein